MKRDLIKYIQSVSDQVPATKVSEACNTTTVWLDELSTTCTMFKVKQEFIHSVMSRWAREFGEILPVTALNDEIVLRIKVYGAI